MATVNLGSIKFKWKGTYSGATAYTIDDVVEYNGSSYICILASTGNLPTNATYFEQMSSAGTNGTNGTDLTSTLTTQGDILYRDGSGLQRLAVGTAGQALLVNSGATAVEWGNAGGGLQSMQVFTSSGTYTKPSGITKIKVIVTGGGGGGGSGSSNYNSSSGGGAGGTAIKFITSGIGATETVTIGLGGNGGASGSSGVYGTAGGTSSFGSHASATGGFAGNENADPAVFTRGVGSGGDINITGGDAQGYQGGTDTPDSAGGSMGGASYWGGGGMTGGSSFNSASGQAYGSGGGGGDHDGASTFTGGGNGKAGIIVVEEYA
jgi:hypothetical protein